METTDIEATARNRVYKQLRRAIIMGHRAPGERLSVDELCQLYGSGISPVRDALQMLGQEGLVSIKPRSGYFITSVTLKELRDMLELREILEVASIERAALRIAAYELIHRPDVPYRVVINEAIDTTKRFGSEHGHTYVNGVLDRAAAEWRATEWNSR